MIVYSQGAGANGGLNRLTDHCASPGYVVISHSHAQIGAGGRFRSLRSSIGKREAWLARATDVRLVLDHLAKLPKEITTLERRIDSTKFGRTGRFGGKRSEIFGQVKSDTLAFWDATLKTGSEARVHSMNRNIHGVSRGKAKRDAR